MAVVASGRLGNVASVIMDEPEPCRLCGVNGSVEDEEGTWPAVAFIATKIQFPNNIKEYLSSPLPLASFSQSIKPVSQLYSSLIF